MAAIARQSDVPLATNMVVTDYKEFAENVRLGCPVRIVLSDHHYWGGLRTTQQLSAPCARPLTWACPCTPTRTWGSA